MPAWMFMQLKIFRVVGKTQTFFSCQEIHSVCSSYYRTTAPSTLLPILAVALLGSRVSAAARCCSVQLVCSRATKAHHTGTRVSSSACLARYPWMQDTGDGWRHDSWRRFMPIHELEGVRDRRFANERA